MRLLSIGVVLCVLKGSCNMTQIKRPFISPWITMTYDGTSPETIAHNLNELPAKVDVQVKINEGGQEYIFPGLGSVPKDDDIGAEYGGVAYSYNISHVLLYVPHNKGGTSAGRVITTGGGRYTGPFVGSALTCAVRVRAWRLSDWPKPDFTKSGLTISKGNPYLQVHHCMNNYPTFVTVQLILANGFVSEGLGIPSLTDDHSSGTSACGTLFGVNSQSITLWAASKYYDFVACYRDGWGRDGRGDSVDLNFTTADVTIRAWQLTSSDLVFTSEFSYTKGGTPPGIIPFGTTIDLDHHLVIVEVRDATVTRGRVFYGGGSANLGHSGENYGGVLFAYNQSEALLWVPSASSGYLIYVGGLWGDGSDNFHSNNVIIKTTVIQTGYTECSIPPDIPNALKLYNGTLAGSRTLYACFPGFSSNGGSPEVVCDGLAWSTTSYSCSVSSTPTVPVTTSGTTTTAATTTTTLATTPQTTTPPVACIPVTTNNISLEEFNAIVEGLKVPKSNTSSHKRSLTCAYDPRPSSTAIGGVGIGVLCSVFALLFILDCTTITKEDLDY